MAEATNVEVQKEEWEKKYSVEDYFSEAYLLECIKQYNVVCLQPKRYMSEGKVSFFLSACVQKPFYR